MYMYNNRPSYDTRKNGLVCDLDFGNFGFESIWSDFGQAGIAGFRGHVKPLQYTDAKDIPVIGNFEVGATFASDFNDQAGIIAGTYDHTKRLFNSTNDKGSMSIYGFDLGLPILNNEYLGLKFYYDYSKIASFGSGSAIGLLFNFNLFGLANSSLKFERRINGDKYIAGYFGSMYEIERFALDTTKGTFTSKALTLDNTKGENGFFGELTIDLLKAVTITGSYQRLDDSPKSGILHLVTDISPKDGSIVARAGYDKINIQDEKDLFTLDDRSYLYTEIGYKPLPYLLCSMVYNWTFTPIRDKDDKVIDFKTQKKIEPRISFIYPFNLAGSK